MTAGRSSRRIIAIAPLFVTVLTAACTPAGGLLGGGTVARSDPASLIGLAPQQVGEVLGMPELQRREPPAEVWQYRTRTCVFDLYFYEEDGGSQAAHYEARSRSNGEIEAAACLGSVVERSRLASTEDPEPAPAS